MFSQANVSLLDPYTSSITLYIYINVIRTSSEQVYATEVNDLSWERKQRALQLVSDITMIWVISR